VTTLKRTSENDSTHLTVSNSLLSRINTDLQLEHMVASRHKEELENPRSPTKKKEKSCYTVKLLQDFDKSILDPKSY